MDNKLNEIDLSIKYEGYLWVSDETQPIVLMNQCVKDSIMDYYQRRNKNVVDLINSVNPFIIEGQLSDGKTSISIKYVDGNYIVKKYALSDMEDIEKKEIYYLPNRMKELDNKSLKLCFNQYWRPKADKYCAGNIDNPDSVDNGMQVLQPAELVFVGFKIKED